MASHNLVTLSSTDSTLLSRYGTHSGSDVTIQNINDSGYIYIGGNNSVSSENYGFRIMPNHSISFELPGRDSIYAIASSNGMKAAIMITNLETGS